MRTFRPLLWLLCLSCSDAERAEPSAAALEAERHLSELSAKTAPRAETTPLAELAALQVLGAQADSAHARIVLQFTGQPPFRRRERALGRTRLVSFTFEDTKLGEGVPELRDVARAGLVRIASEREAEAARVDIELLADARYELYVLDEPRRLVIDVDLPIAKDPHTAPLVLLDPGHGGQDFGSPGPHGLWEGTLTLDITRRLRSWLTQLAPKARVRMTRDSDVYITLEERAAMANALGAALFVSVHLNAANTTVDHGGVATYVLDVNNDRNVLRLAARENGTRTTEVSPLQYLVGSLARSEQRASSTELAQLIQRGTLASARRYLPNLADRGVKSAMFYVLVGAQMPAVLVEGSFITQPDEAAQLATGAYRDALAEGIARGIAKYLEEN